MRTKTIVETETKNVREMKKDPITLDNGAVYTGEWMDGLRDGQGTQIWPDGSKYEGTWAQGVASGKGKLVHADGDIYEGDWLDD